MSETPTAAATLEEQLWHAIADTRDAYPREKNDAPTDEVVAAVLPVVAAELRRIADPRSWIIGPGAQVLDALRARADELDPPATREA